MDRRDLLTDNVYLLQQFDTFGGHHAFPFLPGMLKPRLRDVTSLPSWIYCFLAYIAIQANDQGVRDRQAYARLMGSEARRHGGSNWLDYECVFRRQAILDPSLRTLCTLEFRQQHWLVALLVQPCFVDTDHTAGQCVCTFLSPALAAWPWCSFETSAGGTGKHMRVLEQMALHLPMHVYIRHVCATCIWLEIVQHPHSL